VLDSTQKLRQKQLLQGEPTQNVNNPESPTLAGKTVAQLWVKSLIQWSTRRHSVAFVVAFFRFPQRRISLPYTRHETTTTATTILHTTRNGRFLIVTASEKGGVHSHPGR